MDREALWQILAVREAQHSARLALARGGGLPGGGRGEQAQQEQGEGGMHDKRHEASAGSGMGGLMARW